MLAAAALLAAVGYGITFPLLSLRLEATGATGAMVGLHAAMPAVGWLLGAALIPILQIRFGVHLRYLFLLFLVLAAVALAGLRFAEGYAEMTVLRLLFGGAIGSFFRSIEYWITGVAEAGDRGRSIGLYNILFMVAIVLGSSLQPELGTAGWSAFAPPLVLLVTGLPLLLLWSGEPVPAIDVPAPRASLRIAMGMPVALLAVLAYGMYECAPTTLLQVYVVRNGFDAATAAYTLSAAALGNILMQYPVTALSDRVGRTLPLLLCAVAAAVAAASIPLTLGSTGLYLAAVGVLGGAAGCMYSVALAMIGDHFRGGQLVIANAAFGAVYAVGSIAGPLVNGLAIDQMQTHGLLVSLSLSFAGMAAVILAGQLTFARRDSR